MRKIKKSLFSIFLNGFANIFSFKEYSRRPEEPKAITLKEMNHSLWTIIS